MDTQTKENGWDIQEKYGKQLRIGVGKGKGPTLEKIQEEIQMVRKCEENAKKIGVEMDEWFVVDGREYIFSSSSGLMIKFMELPDGGPVCNYLGAGDELTEEILSGKEKVTRKKERDKINLGNVCKYITRAGLKDGVDAVEDLKKAKQHLDFELKRLTEE